MIYWKRWKKIRTKFETLRKRGIDKQKAWEWANTSQKYWRVACSPLLHLALGDAFLEKQGWIWIGLAGILHEWTNLRQMVTLYDFVFRPLILEKSLYKQT